VDRIAKSPSETKKTSQPWPREEGQTLGLWWLVPKTRESSGVLCRKPIARGGLWGEGGQGANTAGKAHLGVPIDGFKRLGRRNMGGTRRKKDRTPGAGVSQGGGGDYFNFKIRRGVRRSLRKREKGLKLDQIQKTDLITQKQNKKKTNKLKSQATGLPDTRVWN